MWRNGDGLEAALGSCGGCEVLEPTVEGRKQRFDKTKCLTGLCNKWYYLA